MHSAHIFPVYPQSFHIMHQLEESVLAYAAGTHEALASTSEELMSLVLSPGTFFRCAGKTNEFVLKM